MGLNEYNSRIPSPVTSAPPQSPLQPLTSVPVLLSSVSSFTDVVTPTSRSLVTESLSSLGCTLSTYPSSSFMSQSSLNSSVFNLCSRSLQFEDLEVEPEAEQEEPHKPEVYTESEISILMEIASFICGKCFCVYRFFDHKLRD